MVNFKKQKMITIVALVAGTIGAIMFTEGESKPKKSKTEKTTNQDK